MTLWCDGTNDFWANIISHIVGWEISLKDEKNAGFYYISERRLSLSSSLHPLAIWLLLPASYEIDFGKISNKFLATELNGYSLVPITLNFVAIPLSATFFYSKHSLNCHETMHFCLFLFLCCFFCLFAITLSLLAP